MSVTMRFLLKFSFQRHKKIECDAFYIG